MNKLRRTLCSALVALPMAIGGMAHAADWPTRPVTMVVPFPPGGPTDIVARILGQQLSQQLGQTVIIENKGGANGSIGTGAVAAAKPDGYTFLYNTSSLVLAPLMLDSVSFDPVKDFAPVTSTAMVPLALLVHPSVPANNLKEFIDYAKANPGKLSYSSSGVGNITHLGAFLFSDASGIDAVHVPYRGSAPAMVDLVGGQVQYGTNTLNDSLQFIKDGRLKVFAITSKDRSELLPDVPTMAEAAIPGFEVGAWQGIVAPAGTPDAIVQKMNAEVLKALKSDTVREQLLKQGTQALGSTPAEYGAYIANEYKRFGDIIKGAGAAKN